MTTATQVTQMCLANPNRLLGYVLWRCDSVLVRDLEEGIEWLQN